MSYVTKNIVFFFLRDIVNGNPSSISEGLKEVNAFDTQSTVRTIVWT